MVPYATFSLPISNVPPPMFEVLFSILTHQILFEWKICGCPFQSNNCPSFNWPCGSSNGGLLSQWAFLTSHFFMVPERSSILKSPSGFGFLSRLMKHVPLVYSPCPQLPSKLPLFFFLQGKSFRLQYRQWDETTMLQQVLLCFYEAEPSILPCYKVSMDYIGTQ